MLISIQDRSTWSLNHTRLRFVLKIIITYEKKNGLSKTVLLTLIYTNILIWFELFLNSISDVLFS
jgi:hypothetical protein